MTEQTMTREEAIERLKAVVPRQDHDGYKIKASVLVDSLEALGLIVFEEEKKFDYEASSIFIRW